MAKSYDIVNRMNSIREKSVVRVDDTHEYKINTSKSAVLFIRAISEDKDKDEYDMIDGVVKVALGDEAAEYIDSLNLPVEGYALILNVIFAAIDGITLEELEEKEQEKDEKK